MSRSALSNMSCTMAQAVEKVGDPWTQMILRELFLGCGRFDDLQRHTGISPNTLSTRLKRMEADQLVKRRAYSEHPPRFEYKLTAKGRDLWPLIIAFKQWGDRWLGDGKEPPIALSHKQCGQPTVPLLVCSHCGEPMDALGSCASMSAKLKKERARLASQPQ